jgi:hypothetical protein
MPVSLSGLELQGWRGPPGRGCVGSIDKSKFADFKSLSLDVIFHDCEIGEVPREKIDAFAR